MADSAITSEQEQARKEGLAHIHNKLTEKLEAAKTAEDSTPATTTEPPASNPGADDKTAGLAPTAGGVSGAADKDIPNPAVAAPTPTSEKRKSIFGSFKGYFSNDKKKSAAATSSSTTATTSEETYLGAATVAVTSTVAAVTETVQTYTTGATTEGEEKDKAVAAGTTDGAADDLAAKKASEAEASTANPTDAAAAATTTDEPAAEAETVAKKDGAEEHPANATETDKEKSAKPPGGIPGLGATEDKDVSTHRTNPDAIPIAGGKKVGEEHFGESTVLPEDPGVQPIKETGAVGELLAKATGQPLEGETTANTEANTGTATAGPDATATNAAENATTDEKQPKEKGKFLSKLKAKLSKKNKE